MNVILNSLRPVYRVFDMVLTRAGELITLSSDKEISEHDIEFFKPSLPSV